MQTTSNTYFKWTKLQTTGTAPSPRYGQAMASVGNSLLDQLNLIFIRVQNFRIRWLLWKLQ